MKSGLYNSVSLSFILFFKWFDFLYFRITRSRGVSLDPVELRGGTLKMSAITSWSRWDGQPRIRFDRWTTKSTSEAFHRKTRRQSSKASRWWRAANAAHASASRRSRIRFCDRTVRISRTIELISMNRCRSRRERLRRTTRYRSNATDSWSRSSPPSQWRLPSTNRELRTRTSRSRREPRWWAAVWSWCRCWRSDATTDPSHSRRPTSRNTKSIKVGNICMSKRLSVARRLTIFFSCLAGMMEIQNT